MIHWGVGVQIRSDKICSDIGSLKGLGFLIRIRAWNVWILGRRGVRTEVDGVLDQTCSDIICLDNKSFKGGLSN
jgi:hypothetical protein